MLCLRIAKCPLLGPVRRCLGSRWRASASSGWNRLETAAVAPCIRRVEIGFFERLCKPLGHDLQREATR